MTDFGNWLREWDRELPNSGRPDVPWRDLANLAAQMEEALQGLLDDEVEAWNVLRDTMEAAQEFKERYSE